MRILVINPNTLREMSRTIDGVAEKYASPQTEITTVNPTEEATIVAACTVAKGFSFLNFT